MKVIELVNGGEALVDDCDYNDLSSYLWYLSPSGYAYRTQDLGGGKTRTVNMHNVIQISKKGMEIDHIDMNKLNNQRSNLRLATISQNKQNRRKAEKTSSKYIGVYLSGNKWVAQIKKDKEHIYLGRYKHEAVAALAYNRAAKELYGEHARVNEW